MRVCACLSSCARRCSCACVQLPFHIFIFQQYAASMLLPSSVGSRGTKWDRTAVVNARSKECLCFALLTLRSIFAEAGSRRKKIRNRWPPRCKKRNKMKEITPFDFPSSHNWAAIFLRAELNWTIGQQDKRACVCVRNSRLE